MADIKGSVEQAGAAGQHALMAEQHPMVESELAGGTHRPVIDIDDDIIAVNPGSLSYPRQEGRQPSYAIMEIDRRGKVHFTIAYLRQ